MKIDKPVEIQPTQDAALRSGQPAGAARPAARAGAQERAGGAADSVSLSTTWDQEIRDMIGLAEMPGGIRDLLDGDSPLLEHPRLEHIAIEYSCFQLGYSAETHETYLQATLTW